MASKQRDNKLFYGDNLGILRSFADEIVDLCYIDPPFNSKRNYNQIYNNIGKEDTAQAQAFIDTWTWDDAAERGLNEMLHNEGGVFTMQSIELIDGFRKVLGKGALLAYLVHICLRIAEIYRVLKPTGSFYLHCDPTASHYLKILVDAIFCARTGEFQNEIIWKRTSGHSDAIGFGSTHDTVLYYAKSSKSLWNQVYQPYDEGYVEQYYRYKDPDGRRWMSDNLSASGLAGGGYDYEWKGVRRIWRCPIKTMKKLDEAGEIFYTKNGIPRRKRYLDNAKGLPATDLWDDIEALRSWHKERLGYPTQKPEALLERIIKASSNEGDMVLDAYCGCGTTVAVAQRLNRKWIGIDITYQSISLILKRLQDSYGKKALDNVLVTGVPEDMESAIALANRADDKTRKEFEKWAVLTYSDNRAIINEKKGGDAGIDGIAYILDADKAGGEQQNKKVLFSVKSNKSLSPSVVRDLHGTIERDGAACGFLITLYPMPNLEKEAKKYGSYRNELVGKSIPKIQVVSAEEIIKGERMDLPLPLAVVKSAKRKENTKSQGKLGF